MFLFFEKKKKKTEIGTRFFTKPTDSDFYLNTTCYHPRNIVKDAAKEQFIWLLRICPKTSDKITTKASVKSL